LKNNYWWEQSLAFSGVELEIETTNKLINASGKRKESGT